MRGQPRSRRHKHPDSTYPDSEGGVNIGRSSGGSRAPVWHRPSLATIDGQLARKASLGWETGGEANGLGKANGQAREHLESRG